jgi:hypothetical protein
MLTTTRALVGRVLRPLLKAVEGQYRPGPHHLPITGGWLPDGAPINWWQTGLSPAGGERSAVVERCISLYAETAASLPGAHWRRNARGGRTRVENSALSRVLQRPNDYQTSSDFMLGAVDSLYREGNTYALALRNSRFEVESLHLMNPRQSSPLVVRNEDDGDAEIFYRLGGNAVVDHKFGGGLLLSHSATPCTSNCTAAIAIRTRWSARPRLPRRWRISLSAMRSSSSSYSFSPIRRAPALC